MINIEKENKPLRIGGLYDVDIRHQAGSVWDKNRIAPTVDTAQGGRREPLILTKNIVIGGEQKHQAIKKDGVCTCLTSSMGTGGGYIPMILNEVKVIGQMDNTMDHTFESANRAYDKNGIGPTINCCGGGGLQPKVLEDKQIVAMRGRNPENPSDRTVGITTEQRLEPNKQGICNTLTSVQKDNLVMEKVKIKQATSQGYIECEVGGVADLSFPDSKTRRGRVQENGQVSPTLMSNKQDICRIEKEERFFQQALNTLENGNCEVGDTIDAFNGKVNKSGVSPTITTRPEGFKTAILPVVEKEIINPLKGLSDNGWHFEQNVYDTSSLVRSVKSSSGSGNLPKVIQSYRIRKLTPMECWRLMDFSDEDFHKAEEVNSNTQLYKEAGNAIVRNVLVAIFGQMITGKENVYKEVVRCF